VSARICLSVLVALAVAGSTPSGARPTERHTSDSVCPRGVLFAGGREGIATTSKIVAAVRRGVPSVFGDFTTQGGGPGWHHYQVEGLISLTGGYVPEPGGIARYRREAARRCGRTVARSSWLVLLEFPEAPMASVSSQHMFVTRTGKGWVAW
jgi:hypothetical protein